MDYGLMAFESGPTNLLIEGHSLTKASLPSRGLTAFSGWASSGTRPL